QLSVEEKRSCITAVNEEHGILPLIIVPKLGICNKAYVEVDNRRRGVSKEGDEVQASVYLLVEVDKFDGVRGLFRRLLNRAAEIPAFGCRLICLQVVTASFRFSRVNSTSQVKKVLSPQGIMRKRLHFLHLVQVAGHFFRVHRRNSSCRTRWCVGKACQVERVKSI